MVYNELGRDAHPVRHCDDRSRKQLWLLAWNTRPNVWDRVMNKFGDFVLCMLEIRRRDMKARSVCKLPNPYKRNSHSFCIISLLLSFMFTSTCKTKLYVIHCMLASVRIHLDFGGPGLFVHHIRLKFARKRINCARP